MVLGVDEILAELKEKHGGDLDLENQDYYLFYKDGLFNIYFDHDEKTIKVDLSLSDVIKVYHTDKSLEDALKNS